MEPLKFASAAYMLAQRLGKTEEAQRLKERLDRAFQSNPDAANDPDWQRLELFEINALLYQPPPDGFRQARQRLKALRSRAPGAVKQSSFGVFLAATYGQEYAWEKAQGAAPQALSALVGPALEAIRLAQVAGEADWLRHLADPALGAATAQQDDDLVVMAQAEPAVRQALGLD
jgi:hypothetical protein